MKRHLFIAGFASLAVFATPLFAAGTMTKSDKVASHHVKKVAKKTTHSNLSPTSTSNSSSATPVAPARK